MKFTITMYDKRDDRYRQPRAFIEPLIEEPSPDESAPRCVDPECSPCRWAERNGGRADVDHKFWKAYRRRGIATRRALLVLAFRQAGIAYDEIKFSQRAGCSCPCSPGFIVVGARSAVTGERYRWVSINVIEVEDDSELVGAL